MSDQPLTLAVFQEFQRTLLDRFDRVDAHFDRNDARFDSIDGRLDNIDTRLDGIDGRVDGVDGRFGVVAARFDALNRRLDGFEKNFHSRFDEVAGQFDALSHRLLRLDDEYVLIKGTLKSLEASLEHLQAQGGRLESGHRDLLAAVHRLDERASRTEKRLDELVASEPRYALRDDFHELKTKVEALQARIDALQKRVDPS
jgi:chromosome segregation ATPase